MVAMSRTPPPSCTGNADGLQNALDRRRVHRLAGEGAVEIDDVQVFEALALESAGLRRRIAVEHGRARHVALLETDGEAFLQVDGGEKDHASILSFRDCAQRRAWNPEPQTLSMSLWVRDSRASLAPRNDD